jgi:HAD superfamily hydrolase (TIGR01509 family)
MTSLSRSMILDGRGALTLSPLSHSGFRLEVSGWCLNGVDHFTTTVMKRNRSHGAVVVLGVRRSGSLIGSKQSIPRHGHLRAGRAKLNDVHFHLTGRCNRNQRWIHLRRGFFPHYHHWHNIMMTGLHLLVVVLAIISLCGTTIFVPGAAFSLVAPIETTTTTTVAVRRRSARMMTQRAATTTTSTTTTTTSTTTTKTLEAILWDMDGVLADTERDGHRVAFNEAFVEAGILDTDWTVPLYGELLEIGGGKERMTHHWNQVGWPTTIPTDVTQRASMVKKLHERKTELFLAKIAAIPLRPGVARLIDAAIQQQIQLAVCSTSNVVAVTTLVQTLLGPERAQHISIFAGDMVSRKKPAPDIYNLAVTTLGLKKEHCVIIEDSAIGLGAARAAGMACIVTKSTYTKDEDFTGASMIVDDLGEPGDVNDCVTLDTLTGLLGGERR